MTADQLRAAAGADLGQLTTKADVKTDVAWLRRGLGINIAISLATLSTARAIAWTLLP